MKILDVFQLSTRMFKTRVMRTLLTILGIGVGIGAILFLVSLGYGLQKALISKITSSDALLSLDVIPPTEEAGLQLDSNAIEQISKFNQVKYIAPMASLRGQVEAEGITADAVINMVPSTFFNLAGQKMSAGRFFDDTKKEVVVSQAIVQVLNLENASDILGKEVSILLLTTVTDDKGVESLAIVEQPSGFTVSGVIEDGGSGVVFFPLNQVEDIKINTYSQAKVRVDSTQNLDIVRAQVVSMGFAVAALSDTIDQANKIFRIFQIVLAVFGVIALIVSAIGMFNTMTIALLERTQEVGVMKALGAYKSDIMEMFLTESVVMGFLGGVMGIIIGLIGAEAANFFLNILASRLGGEKIDIFYTPVWFIITIVTFSTAVGFTTGLWPARRAARLNPLEAVRYK